MNIQVSYQKASASFKARNYTQTLAILNQLLDKGKDVRTYLLLAKTLTALNLKNEAARAYLLASDAGNQPNPDYLAESIKLHFDAGNKDEALALASRLQLKDQMIPDIAYVIASALFEKGQLDILKVFREVLMKSPKLAHMQLGARLTMLSWDVMEASEIETARVLFSRLPNDNRIRLLYLTFCREHNKFDVIERHQPILDKAILAGELDFVKADTPFFNVNWSGEERINRLARANTPRFDTSMTEKRRSMPHAWGEKVRVGYLSSDLFDQHATMKLVRRIMELHDRDRFEVTLFCHTSPSLLRTNSANRSDWGSVVSIVDMTNEQAAEEIRRRQIDVLVDLKGHTRGNRVAILNEGAAPVQVTWLGFPGPVINVDLDYAIGDPIVLPLSSAPHYLEKFCRLPETYQPNDPYNRPLVQASARHTLGLPEDAFVFASFNASRKISLDVINAWVKILKRTPGSLISIFTKSPESRSFIRRKMVDSGISERRLIFMLEVEFQLHLNRMPCMDLGLDTFPYNGHTTTSEQLWAGLPVLAVKGTNFASRVSESLLEAIGVPDLVAETVESYIDKAVYLFNNRESLEDIRQRIVQNRFINPLFDAERFCRHIETAYEMMVDRAKSGLEPDHFDVPPLPPRTERFLIR